MNLTITVYVMMTLGVKVIDIVFCLNLRQRENVKAKVIAVQKRSNVYLLWRQQLSFHAQECQLESGISITAKVQELVKLMANVLGTLIAHQANQKTIPSITLKVALTELGVHLQISTD